MTFSKWIGCSLANYNQGRSGYKPEFIVIHIMDGSLSGTDAWFNNPAAHVSAHSGVGKNGEVHDYVHSTDTAYHAGVYNTKGATFQDFKYVGKKLISPNLYTLGLEHEGHDEDATISEECYKASASKIAYWAKRFGIPIDARHIVSHQSIYAGHHCPGDTIKIERLIEMAKVAVPIMPE